MLPAYIRLKYKKTCSYCQKLIEVNALAFWIGESKEAYHGSCGKDEWKVSGSPYSIRKSSAIMHKDKGTKK